MTTLTREKILDGLIVGIETRRSARGFYMPEDISDLATFARSLIASDTQRRADFITIENANKEVDRLRTQLAATNEKLAALIEAELRRGEPVAEVYRHGIMPTNEFLNVMKLGDKLYTRPLLTNDVRVKELQATPSDAPAPSDDRHTDSSGDEVDWTLQTR